MKSLLTLILLVFSINYAQANDSSIAFLKVQGVNPNSNPANSRVVVYGGNELIYFFNALPSLAPWYDADFRSVQMISGAWVASIDCSRFYARPGTGDDRYDYQCSFGVSAKTPQNDPESNQFLGDAYVINKFHDGFSNFWGSNRDMTVLGILPDQVKNEGEVYSFYGKSTKLIADVLMQRGDLVFNSPAYSVRLSCQQYYIHPNTGAFKDDYKCALNYNKN